MKKMNADEAVVDHMLRGMGFANVIYEPDGIVPPDFLADDRIAIEVRRLNQNHDAGDGMRGLEEIAVPLWQKFERLLASMGPATGESWFAFVAFSRPIGSWKAIEPSLRLAMQSFMGQPSRTQSLIFRGHGINVEVVKASRPHQSYFLLGGTSDRQSGGFIVAQMISNIEYCASEKSKKIAGVRGKYGEWWLALVDHIGLGLDDYDKTQLLKHIRRPAGWDKVVVVSPDDPAIWFEF